jgi:immunomodulating metalloprotease
MHSPAGWNIDPLGWGESHELGHNLQRRALNLHYLPPGSSANLWDNYEDRAGENSNNIFPYHTYWNYQRNVLGSTAVFNDDHMDHAETFAILQSSWANMTRLISGVRKRVVVNMQCQVVATLDAATSAPEAAHRAIYESDAYVSDGKYLFQSIIQSYNCDKICKK